MVNNKPTKKRPKPVILVVLDGWGIMQPYSGNAISLAKTPVFDELISKYPAMTLRASGEAVGLPWGESGNSEVGHLNLGLGSIMYQGLPRINKFISDNSFYKTKAFLDVVNHVKQNKSKLHLIGLISTGCVHSSIEHLQALLAFTREQKIDDVFIHAILDGRDTPFNSGLNFIKSIMSFTKEYGVGRIASISGRFYAMDRDRHWDRITKAYMVMAEGIGKQGGDPVAIIEQSYAKKIYDEELVPTVVTKNGRPVAKIGPNDGVIFFNYRSDRASQLTKAFVLPGFEKIKGRKYLQDLFFVCFTEYEKDLPVAIAFPSEKITSSLGKIISDENLAQLRIAETEKYAHVTYFFNGLSDVKQAGEDHVLIPSPQVISYDKKPAMSAPEITEKLIKLIQEDKYDFILINYANADMVGHTGNLKAAIEGIAIEDENLGKVIKSVLGKGGVLLVTADHGNAEFMFNMQTGQIDKEHTSNPVPFIVVGQEYEAKTIGFKDVPGDDLSLVQPQGMLSDVAPTILKIMGIKKPPTMTGMSLF